MTDPEKIKEIAEALLSEVGNYDSIWEDDPNSYRRLCAVSRAILSGRVPSLYTRAQLDAAVAAERERCEKLLGNLASEYRRLQAENERLREGLEHYATNRHWHWNPDRGAWEYNASGSAYYRGCAPLARSTDLPDQEAVDAECGSIARAALAGEGP